MFVHTHCHSNFSARDGLVKIEDYILKSKEFGEAWVITDHGVISGWPEYMKLAKQHGVKAMFGVEVYVNQQREALLKVVDESHHETDAKLKKKIAEKRDLLKSEAHHLILIAKNQTGLYNIIKIANDAYVNYFYSRPLVDYTTLFANKEGIIVSTACLAGPINRWYEQGKDIYEYIDMMKEQFGDDFYLEVQANGIKEQKKLNKVILEAAEKTKTKILIGCDSHYLKPEDADTHQDLLLLQNRQSRNDLGKVDLKVIYENKNGERKTKKFKDPENELFRKIPVKDLKEGQVIGKETIVSVDDVSRVWTFSSDSIYFKSFRDIEKEIKKHHKELIPIVDEIFKNNSEIYDKVEQVEFNVDLKLPIIENAKERFVQLIKEGMKKKNLVERKYVDRIKYELSVIKRFQFETYFLILVDLVDYARNQGIAIGAGRGSVAGSLVAYALDLHKINPFDERWDTTGEGLPFSRFLDESKLYDHIMVTDEKGEIHDFLEIDQVQVKRNNQIIDITAAEIQDNDEVILEA